MKKKKAQTSKTYRAQQRRPKQQKGHLLSGVLKGLFVFALIGGLAYAFTMYLRESPRFKVATVRIAGADVLREEAVLGVANITTEHNLLTTDTNAVADRVQNMPYVKVCEVRRAYPDTLVIDLVERRPVAALMVNNHTFEVDSEGVVLREIDSLSPHEGPLITNVQNLGFVEPGQRIQSASFHRALNIWSAFSTSHVSEALTVSEIAARNENLIEMYCDEVTYVLRWGRGNPDEQAERLEILWETQNGKLPCNRYLDLRFGRDLVCK